jgi:ABC-type glycerol-3-phosphate transport system substrate-binding protein
MHGGRLSRRRLVAGLLAGAGAGLLAACGRPSTATWATAGPSGATRSITLRTLKPPRPEAQAYLTETIDTAARHGDFRVALELLDEAELLKRDWQGLTAEPLPDLFLTLERHNWVDSGAARDVGDLYDQIGRDGGGWLDCLDPLSAIDGRRLGIPLDVQPWPLHLRRDLFAAAGVALPFVSFDAMVEGFKQVTGGAVHGFGGPLSASDWDCNVLSAMLAHGGRLFDAAGRPTILTPRNLAGFAAYVDLFLAHQAIPPAATAWDDSGNNAAYLNGQAAAVSNPLTIPLAMVLKNDADLLAKTMFAPWPAAAGGAPVVGVDAALLVISRTSPHPDLAAQVIAALLSPARYPGLVEAYDPHGFFPGGGPFGFAPLKRHQALPIYTRDEWKRQIVQAVLPHGRAPHADAGATPVFAALTTAFGQALSAAATQGKPPAEALAVVAEAATAADERRAKR